MNHSPRRASGWRLSVRVLAPSLIVVLLVGALAIASVRTLGAVRGYVGGESLWSKARSEAVLHLRHYALSRDPQDFARFEQALAVPLADRAAREEMERPHPRREVIRTQLRAGGIHPDDIDNMAVLFIWFGESPLFKDALDIWRRADEQVAFLQEQAQSLRRRVEAGEDPAALRPILQEIDLINETMRSLEIGFSTSLSSSARLTEQLLILGIVLVGGLLSIGSFWMIRKPLMQQASQQMDLIRANRRWELAVAGSGLGLFELDYSTGEVQLDARTAELCGLGAQARTLTREEMFKLIAPEDAPASTQAIELALTTGQMYQNRTRIVMPDGQMRHIASTGRVVVDPVSGHKRLMGVSRDVTQELAQSQLALERDAAEKIAESQRAFLSRLSHELRTPLNAVLGFAQLLSIDKAQPLSPAQQKQVKWILDAGSQLLNLVEDVLDLSKVEMGEIDIQIQPCDTAAILEAALPLVEGARARHEVQIIDHLPVPAPIVMADPKRLLQIYVNLLSNACKYNRPGGQVTVNTRVEDKAVCIDFGDNGIGLTPQDAAGLFQPFQRVPMASAQVEGTGLGLYIVKQLAERMQGSVSVRSEPGVGSCFTVTLPLAPAQ